MSVKELIARLQACDPDLPVYVSDGDGGTQDEPRVHVYPTFVRNETEQRPVVWIE